MCVPHVPAGSAQATPREYAVMSRVIAHKDALSKTAKLYFGYFDSINR